MSTEDPVGERLLLSKRSKIIFSKKFSKKGLTKRERSDRIDELSKRDGYRGRESSP